jgi:hypothetical protein
MKVGRHLYCPAQEEYVKDHVRLSVLVFGLLLGLVSTRFCGAEDQTDSADVIEAFDIPTDGYPLLVPVTIAGKTFRFSVDTGASGNAFDRKLRPLLGGVRPSGRIQSVVGRANFGVYDAPEAKLGRLLVRRPPPHPTAEACCFDLSYYRLGTGDDVQGLLGISFLKDYVVRLDFDEGKLFFLSSVGSDPGKSLPLNLETGTPRVRAHFGEDIEASFDVCTGRLGASGMLGTELMNILERNGRLTAREGNIESNGQGLFKSRTFDVNSFGLSVFRHSHLQFVKGPKGPTNVLNLPYLARYIVTFDFPRRMMYLKPSRNFARRESDPPRGIIAWGVYLSCLTGEVCIGDVVQGSPAARAGVRLSDVIVAIDGTDVNAPRDFSIHRLFCTASDTLRLTVRRRKGTKELTLKFPKEASTDKEAAGNGSVDDK